MAQRCFDGRRVGATQNAVLETPVRVELVEFPAGSAIVNLLFSVCFATGYIHSGEIKIFNRASQWV